jgi:hypothetical protein
VPKERTDAELSAEPADPKESSEPAEPIDRIDPAEPIERMDPVEPTDRIEPVDHRDQRDRRRRSGGTQAYCREMRGDTTVGPTTVGPSGARAGPQRSFGASRCPAMPTRSPASTTTALRAAPPANTAPGPNAP